MHSMTSMKMTQFCEKAHQDNNCRKWLECEGDLERRGSQPVTRTLHQEGSASVSDDDGSSRGILDLARLVFKFKPNAVPSLLLQISSASARDGKLRQNGQT